MVASHSEEAHKTIMLEMISPMVVQFLLVTGRCPSSEPDFNFMNRVCLHGVVVLQEAMSVADVILWSALYPMLSDSGLDLSKYNNMKTIHKQLCVSGLTT